MESGPQGTRGKKRKGKGVIVRNGKVGGGFVWRTLKGGKKKTKENKGQAALNLKVVRILGGQARITHEEGKKSLKKGNSQDAR